MKFFIHTTGCKANQCDTHVIAEGLKKEGLVPAPASHADIIIINACTLTDGAERDIRRFISRSRRTNDHAKIVLAGCHAQVYPARDYGADLVVGQKKKFHIGTYIGKDILSADVTKKDFAGEGPDPGHQDGRTRFFLKIQDGCDRFCSYCVVPYARGTPRSMPVKDVLRVMEALKDQGTREVVLTGIEISSYRDQESGTGLKELLRLLEKSSTPERIRMSSIDPLSLDDDMIELIAASGKIAKSLHIPLQSASDSLLKRMGRGYTRRYMEDLTERLNKAISDIGIGMDVIAGFPGEDDVQFMETFTFLESAGIYYLHAFPFSAREGTVAAAMKQQVSEGEKKRRVRVLKELDRKKRIAFYGKFIGRQMEIVPEGKLYRGAYMRGYTGNYLPVHIPFTKRLENNLVTVTIKEIQEGLLMGEISDRQ